MRGRIDFDRSAPLGQLYVKSKYTNYNVSMPATCTTIIILGRAVLGCSLFCFFFAFLFFLMAQHGTLAATQPTMRTTSKTANITTTQPPQSGGILTASPDSPRRLARYQRCICNPTAHFRATTLQRYWSRPAHVHHPRPSPTIPVKTKTPKTKVVEKVAVGRRGRARKREAKRKGER